MADRHLIQLYYFDESGFTTVPVVPYAWQPPGETCELPSFRSQRLNVLGFMSRDQRSYFHVTETVVDSTQVIAAFDAFSRHYAEDYARHHQPCVVILDNASTHTSMAFRSQQDVWGARGVVLHYLPPYSPELNLIEILWRRIKHDWLPLGCYTHFSAMKTALHEVLDGFGSKYQINFA